MDYNENTNDTKQMNFLDLKRFKHTTFWNNIIMLGDNLDDDYEMHVYPSSYNSPAQIVLFRNHEEIYRKPIWENGRSTLKEQIMFIWNLYRKSKKECGTLKESQLLGRLAEKEQTIQFLESKLADSSVQDRLLNEEISQYRKLLLEIQEMLNATKICVNLQEDY